MKFLEFLGFPRTAKLRIDFFFFRLYDDRFNFRFLSYRFSGITEEDLKNVRTTIRDVQAVLLSYFSDKTILIGHSFDSDLRALRV